MNILESLEPQRKIANHEYDWIFHLGVGLAIVLTIINIILRVKKTKFDTKFETNRWILDIIAILSAFLILLYHYLYRWQLEMVLIFLVLFICSATLHTLKILNIKNLF